MSKFLIVDDSRHVQSMLKALIEAENHTVIFADNGADALEKARSNPPDMVVSDIMMPVMDGFTLCRKWKNDDNLKRIPFVLYTTASADGKDEEDALNIADKLIPRSPEPEVFMKVMLDLISNAEHIKAMAGNPYTGEEESYKLYNDRLVRKLEEKTLQLEQEIARHRQTEEDLILHQIELEMQNVELRKSREMLERASAQGSNGDISRWRTANQNETAQRKTEAELERYREHFEELVKSRTCDLEESNQMFKKEIEERKKTEEQLKLMALFAELNPAPVLRFNREGEILMANPAALEIFRGVCLKGAALKSILPGLEGTDLTSYIDNGAILSYPVEIGKRLFHFTLKGIPDIGIGQIYGDDITELKQVEEVLLKSEERYRRITNAVTDYIYTVRLEEGVPVETVHGDNCLAVTGYTRAEFAADPYLWINMVLEDDHDIVLQQAEGALAGRFSPSIQHRIIRKDGEIRWVESMIVPNFDMQERLVSYDGLIRDITMRKKLEEQVVHSQKMDSIGKLAGGVAHDFNNILTAIIGFSSILTRKIPEDNPSRFYVDQIQLAAESAANLTGSLLAFSRKQKINPMPLNVNTMIHKMEKLLSRIIREDIDFRTVLLDNSLNVMADFSQMQQVLMNLVTNAKDAMPGGGSLVLTAESFTIDGHFVKCHGFGKPGRYALIAISDTGIGIDKKSKEKIFEPFYTSKEVNKGTGLGLSIVYGIIKQHKGYIDVESEPGKGTTVEIYLPLIETGEDPGTGQSKDALPRGGRETILLVEDNSMTRQFLASELEEFGYGIIAAGDGEEALSVFHEHIKDIQLLITDVIMPKKSGREVYAAIKKLRPDIKALFLSGYSREMLLNETPFIREVHFMSKPLKTNDLLRKVREILDEK